MFPLTTWAAFGPDIIGGLCGGIVGGLAAWRLLRMTQRDEAKIRAEAAAQRDLDERKKVASALILQVRDLSDLLGASNLRTIIDASTYRLRNQIAISEFDLGGRPVMLGLKKYAAYCRSFRNWVRYAPEDVSVDLTEPQSRSFQHLNDSQVAIAAFADALEERLRIEVTGGTATLAFPGLPKLDEWPPF